jgi:predicted Zn-dependent protease
MRTVRFLVAALLVGFAAGPGSYPIGATGEPLLDILEAELQRNVRGLASEDVPPYFGSYTVHDERTTRIVAAFGALARSDESHRRSATVQIRVGDYALDNTHSLRGDFQGAPSGLTRVSLPLSDDEKPVRLALWRATDRAFKQAVQTLTRVRTNVAAKVQDDNPAPDFSRETPVRYGGEPVRYALDVPLWEARLRRISAPFSADPVVFNSNVSLQIEAVNRYYTNTEGSRVATGALSYRLFLQALTKADDGMELPLYVSHFARTVDGLPDETQLITEAREMVDLLRRLRTAPVVDPYSGPAILSGRAAGVFFHEIFGHRVEGHRQKDADDGQTFARQVGQPVLPPFLDVVFDPTRRALGDVQLMGHYQYDDEGVQARPVTVVDDGVLRTFLIDRAPLSGFPRSNGHGRAEPGYMPVSRQSNLMVQSSRAVPSDELIEMLREEARRQNKPFGLLFDSIEGGFTTTGRGGPNAFNVLPNVVYRIYTDGRAPELVRGVDLIGTPLSAFGKIVATGDTVDIFNGLCGAESGNVPVSASSPALLVSEVEVQKKAQSQEALPILAAPPKRS